jgi:hypothetical protein
MSDSARKSSHISRDHRATIHEHGRLEPAGTSVGPQELTGVH